MTDFMRPFCVNLTASSALKTIWPTAAPGEAGRPGCQNFNLLALLIQPGYKKIVELVGLHAENGFLFRDQLLVHHVDGDMYRCQPGALGVARLQHVQLAVLNREFKILHVAIMLFHLRGQCLQLLRTPLGICRCNSLIGLRRADSGNNVLTLRVQQVLAKKLTCRPSRDCA